MRVLAAISERGVLAKILSHLDLPTALPQPAPARAPPWTDDELEQEELEFGFNDALDQDAVADLELASDDQSHRLSRAQLQRW
jgi:hypothetical protein